MANPPAQIIQQNKAASTYVDNIKYPTDLGPFYFSMNFYEYRRGASVFKSYSQTASTDNLDPLRRIYNDDKQSVDAAIMQPSSFSTIQLPIPTNLVDRTAVTYEQKQYGGAVGALGAIMGGIQGAMNSSVDGNGNVNLPAESSAGTVAALSAEALAKSAARGDLFFGADFSSLYDQITGTAVNPNLTVLFRGPTLKNHNFSWKVSPRSLEDSYAIKKIEAIIKRAMSPKLISQGASAVIQYPCECLPQFHAPDANQPMGKFLYPMRPCVVTQFSVNKAPSGVNSFHQDSYEPSALIIEISLQETSYNTRDSFDNPQEYASDGFNTTQFTKGGVGAFGTDTDGVAPPKVGFDNGPGN